MGFFFISLSNEVISWRKVMAEGNEISDLESTSVKVSKGQWLLRAYCLSDSSAHIPPQKDSILNYIGLGSKDILIDNYTKMIYTEFYNLLTLEFPRLKGEDSFDLMKCYDGRLYHIPKPWRIEILHEHLSGSEHLLYIRPKRTLTITQQELNDAESVRDLALVKKKETQLKKLAFGNPGSKSKFLEDFDPERSGREMRKMKRKIYCEKSRKASVYNEQGILIHDRRDLCDCCEQHCPGCHFPCPKCKSAKCGLECRVYRKYAYTQFEAEGLGRKLNFSGLLKQ